MANPFCLVKDDVDRFKQALKDGTLDPEKLIEMSSDDRRKAFADVVGDANARELNASFEQKLLLRNVQQGLVNWAKSVAGMKPNVRRDITAKIENMKFLEPADEKSFLKDLARQKLGVSVSYDEVKQIAEHTAKLKELAVDKDQFGNPTPEYFKQLRDTKSYVQSLNEGSTASHFVSIARNFLLASVKTPLKVTVEQTANQIIELTARAISYGKGGGLAGANPKLAYDYTKNAMKVYQESGYNQASMNSLSEGNMFGDTFSHHEGLTGFGKGSLKDQGVLPAAKGAVRQFSKGLDRVVIHYLHGVVFNAHFNAAFADTINRESTRIAKSEGLVGAAQKARAASLFKEAATIGTDDPVAAKIRAQGQQDAMRVTNTNTTIGSKWGAGVKSALNSISGPVKIGDWTIPFSKIPGSIYSNAVDVAGAGIPRAMFQLKKAVTEGKETGKYNFQQPIRTLLRTAGGITGAAILASYIPKENYDEKRGMIKLFGKVWVSTELLGPIGPAVTGILQAKYAPIDKTHPGRNNVAYNYAAGVLKGAWNLPGLHEIKDIGDYGIGDYLSNFVTSRIAPSIVRDVYNSYQAGNPLPVLAGAKVKTDDQVRNVNKDRFDPSRVSPGALESQTKHARFTKEMDMIDAATAQGADTTDLKEELQGKLERTKTPLTDAEAERANKLLGTDEYKGEISDEEAAKKPQFDKYNKNADGIIDKVSTWAQAIGTDPVDAFDKLFKGETIERLENGTIIVKRMDKDGPQGSTAARKKLGGGGQDVKLDHTVPLEIGGTNDASNLRLVTTDEWAQYTPVENYLAGALHDGKISGKDAQDLIVKFKNGSLSRDALIKQVGEPFNDLTPKEDAPRSFKVPGLPKAPRMSVH